MKGAVGTGASFSPTHRALGMVPHSWLPLAAEGLTLAPACQSVIGFGLLASDWDTRLWVWHGAGQLLLVKGDIQEKGQL